MVNERLIASFSYYTAPNEAATVDHGFPIDLNGDGVQEIIFAGHQSRSVDRSIYGDTVIRIFGWSGQTLVDQTDKWLPNGTSRIEATGEIVTGDFNNDGLTDFFSTANADTDRIVNAYQFINRGTYFERQLLGSDEWQHGAGGFDVNGDGYSDVAVASISSEYDSGGLYLGGPTGLTKEAFIPAPRAGADIALGHFSDSKILIAVTDAAPGINGTDNFILELMFSEDGALIGSEIAQTLPLDTMWPDASAHTVQAYAVDLNEDGWDDLILMTQEGRTIEGLPNKGNVSEISFFMNDGSGYFSRDENKISGYDRNSQISYAPVFADFNRDGRVDMLVSESNYSEPTNSTAFLVQNGQGVFVEYGRAHFNSLVGVGDYMTAIEGPAGFSILRMSPQFTDGQSYYNVYESKLSEHWVNIFGIDPLAYIASHVDLILAFGLNTDAGFQHFIDHGFNEGRATNAFDGLAYIASHNDLISAFGTNGVNGLKHFITNGYFEGRKITFNGLEYIAGYADLIDAFGQDANAGATHFITNGHVEGRNIRFDSLEYVASYGDLITAFGADNNAGAAHFISNGEQEGREVNFDGLEYIASYADLIAAFGTNSEAGTVHFINNGYDEGRDITFDGLNYIASYGDLIEAFGTDSDAGAKHFITNGLAEGRQDDFNAKQYLDNYHDLVAAFGSDLAAATTHYIQFGFEEGRTDGAFLG